MQNPRASGKAAAAGLPRPPAEKEKTSKKKQAAVKRTRSTGMKSTSPGVDIGNSSSLIAAEVKNFSVTDGAGGQASTFCDSKFTTDSILADLLREQREHPKQEVVTKGNIRHFQYHEISAYISLYFEDDRNFVQFRVGYIYDAQVAGGSTSPTSSPAALKKKNFRGFLGLEKNNPYVLRSGHKVTFREMFLSEPADEKHRFGADFILDDIGLESCAELLNYVLTCKF